MVGASEEAYRALPGWRVVVRQRDAEEAVRLGRVVRVYPDDVGWAFADRGKSAPIGWQGITVAGGQVDLDHNPRLSPHEWRGLQSIGAVDRMVREDPVLQALRLALTLPLLSGTWTIEPPPDPDPRELEATDLVRSLLFEQLAGVATWPALLEHVLSYAWRGWSLTELYWPWDRASRRTRLGVRPLLPWTVDRWHAREEGWAAEQVRSWVDPTGGIGGSWSGRTLEPEELLHLRWMPEADNPEPYGPLRACWADWMGRSTMRKLEIQGYQRAVYGVPYVEVDPEAPGFDGSSGVVDRVNAALQELRAGLRAANIFPPGYSLKFAEFPFRADEIRVAITDLGHSMMTAVHATFLRTGETRGALALHDGQVEFFGRTLRGIAEGVAAAFSAGPRAVLKRIVERNLPGLQRFPWLQAPEVRIGDPAALVAAIVAASQQGVLLDGDRAIEDRTRDLLGLPARAPRVVVPGDGGADPGSEAENERTEEIEEEGAAAIDLRLADARVVADRYQSGPGGRAVRPVESAVSNAETRGRTEAARDRLAGVVEAWRQDIAPEYAGAVADAATLDAARAVPVPRQRELRERLRQELRQVYRAGGESFRAEQERIAADPALRDKLREGRADVGRGGDVPSPQRLATRGLAHVLGHRLAAWRAAGGRIEAQGRAVSAPALARVGLPALAIDDIDPEESIEAVLSTTVSAAVERIRSESARALQAAGIGGAMPAAPAGRGVVAEVVAGLSSGVDVGQAQGDVNTIFGLGRQHEARAEGVERFVYSNLLESATCGPCAGLDGTVFAAEELDTYATPYSGCEGGDRCNCLTLGIPSAGEE